MSFRPKVSPLPLGASNDTKIGVTTCFPHLKMALFTSGETGSDECSLLTVSYTTEVTMIGAFPVSDYLYGQPVEVPAGRSGLLVEREIPVKPRTSPPTAFKSNSAANSLLLQESL